MFRGEFRLWIWRSPVQSRSLAPIFSRAYEDSPPASWVLGSNKRRSHRVSGARSTFGRSLSITELPSPAGEGGPPDSHWIPSSLERGPRRVPRVSTKGAGDVSGVTNRTQAHVTGGTGSAAPHAAFLGVAFYWRTQIGLAPPRQCPLDTQVRTSGAAARYGRL